MMKREDAKKYVEKQEYSMLPAKLLVGPAVLVRMLPEVAVFQAAKFEGFFSLQWESLDLKDGFIVEKGFREPCQVALTISERERLRADIQNHPLIRTGYWRDRKRFSVEHGVAEAFGEVPDVGESTSTSIDSAIYRMEVRALLPAFLKYFYITSRTGASESPAEKPCCPHKGICRAGGADTWCSDCLDSEEFEQCTLFLVETKRMDDFLESLFAQSRPTKMSEQEKAAALEAVKKGAMDRLGEENDRLKIENDLLRAESVKFRRLSVSYKALIDFLEVQSKAWGKRLDLDKL